MAQWPAFRLRWNPLNFRPPYCGTGSEVTRLAEEAEMHTDDPVVALARLIHELLGGRSGGTTALASCSDHLNTILRRALSPGGGLLAFPSAVEFWRALFDENRAVPPTVCRKHTDQIAYYTCTDTGRPLCEGCATERKFGGTSVRVCEHCGGTVSEVPGES